MSHTAVSSLAPPSMQNMPTDTVAIPVKLCNLPPFHSIAHQVLTLTANPDIDLRRLSGVMEGDPAFAAEVLFLANSSLFGFTSRMHVLRHAVAVLGLDRIKALAVTVAMRAFLGVGSPVIRDCWRHSAACAIVSQEIAPIFNFSPDQAYTLGLMHDVGRLGLLRSYTDEITPVLSAEYADTEALRQAECQAVNVDHALAGAWLVKYWELPEDFSAVCARHHETVCVTDPPLLIVAKMSCRIADALGFAAVRYRSTANYQNLVRVLPPVHQRKFPDEAGLRAVVEERITAFEA
jgi:HD-like signal output (HDOD) protein